MKKKKNAELEIVLKGRKLSGVVTEELEAILKALENREYCTLKEIKEAQKLIQKTLRKRNQTSENRTRMTLPIEEGEANLPEIPLVASSTLTLGDINLLVHPVPLTKPPFDAILLDLFTKLIDTTSGALPQMKVTTVKDDEERKERIVILWRVEKLLNLQDILSIQSICEKAYKRVISGRRKNGGWKNAFRYIETNGKSERGKEALYFGPQDYLNHVSIGVIISRLFKSSIQADYMVTEHPDDWMCRETEGADAITEIEIREGDYSKEMPGLPQEDMLFLIVEIAFALVKHKLIEHRKLYTAIFRELNKIGTSPIEREKLFGMQAVLEIVEKVLLLPLEQPHQAKMHHLTPQSILLVGVPGVGKTFLAHFLMTGSYNAIFVSLDTNRLRSDLSNPNMSMTLIRIDKIRNETSLPVILILDDVDLLLDDEEMVARFLNLLQGVREKGFYLLASTNRPEKIDERLLEPGRLSSIIHVPLPNSQDRLGVLKNHAISLPFETENARESILNKIANQTEGWTQRYLHQLCQEASRQCILSGVGGNIQKPAEKNSVFRLTETHFENAFRVLSSAINLKKLCEEDETIKAFVLKQERALGF